MTGNEYQKKAAKTVLYPKELGLYYVTMGLAGEAGEISNVVKKILRDDNKNLTQEKKEILKKEIGDVMWYIARICSELNLNLDDVMEANIEKLYSRMDRGVLRGSGDNR